MIAVVNYGMGNLANVGNALAYLGFEYRISSDPQAILAADKVILPGVGAFAGAIAQMRRTGLDQAVKEAVKLGLPLLGICLGLHLLFSESYEDGIHQGLDLIPGTVQPLPGGPLKVPHMGWNTAVYQREHPWFTPAAAPDYYYFVHSYHVCPADPAVTLTLTPYGEDIVSAVALGSVAAVQFHPEKSGRSGLNILHKFGDEKL